MIKSLTFIWFHCLDDALEAPKRSESDEKRSSDEKQIQRDAKAKDERKKKKEKDREVSAPGSKDQRATFADRGGDD